MRRSRGLARVLALGSAWLLALAGCGGPSTPPAGSVRPHGAVSPAGKVLIIGLDGADWEIIHRLASRGRLPSLSRLEREGASGVMLAEEPLLSPVIWTSIATGRPPLEHGIVGFLTSRGGATEPVRSDERKVRAFWNVASELGVKVGVVGWYASWPAETVDGYLVSDRVGSHQVAGTAAGAATGLVYPDSLLPEIEEQRARVDREIGDKEMVRYFARGEGGGTTVRIRADAVRTFLDVLRTTELYRRIVPWLMQRYDPVVSAVYFEGTDSVGHLFAQYAPPPLPGVDPEQARHLGETFDRYYEHVDGIVGELVSRVDPATTTVLIVSDHGFKSGGERPTTPAPTVFANQAPIWHRPAGVFLLWGRGIRRGTDVGQVSAYDVVPTLFRLVGLPLATRLRGRPVDKALTEEVLARPVVSVEDYEAVGPREMPSPAEASSDEQMAKLRALGYIGEGGRGTGSPVGEGQKGVLLNRYSEAVILFNSGKREEALRAVRALQRDAPGFAMGFLGEGLILLRGGDARSAVPLLEKAAALDPRVGSAYADSLGEAYLEAGRADEGLRVLRSAVARDPSNGPAMLILAQALLRRGDLAGARRTFSDAREKAAAPADRARGAAGLGIVAEDESRPDEAASHYEEALRLSPDLPLALERGAALELRRRRPARAAELMERLLAKRQGSATDLTLYGSALLGAGRTSEARQALERALALDPRQADARRLLDRLKERAP